MTQILHLQKIMLGVGHTLKISFSVHNVDILQGLRYEKSSHKPKW
jgi:hypothetical protein